MSRLSTCLCLALFVFAASAQRGSKKSSKQASKDDGKIVGGVSVDISGFSYQVSLQDVGRGRKQHFCGGSIISPEWILTAAHCTDGSTPSSIEVLAGTTTLRREGGQAQRRKAVEIINHPEYNPSTVDYDIALIKLNQPFTLGGNAQAIELDHNELSIPDDLILSGWGVTRENGQAADTLQATLVPAISRSDCRKQYNGYSGNNILALLFGSVPNNNNRITENMICGGFKKGGKDACQGDSGGPAVSLITKKQVGVVSWGKGCAREGYPGVYTNVARFVDWIGDKTGLNL